MFTDVRNDVSTAFESLTPNTKRTHHFPRFEVGESVIWHNDQDKCTGRQFDTFVHIQADL